MPFTTEGSEIFASLEYVMEPKSAADGGGQGLCVYLCDPEVDGWDRYLNHSGALHAEFATMALSFTLSGYCQTVRLTVAAI